MKVDTGSEVKKVILKHRDNGWYATEPGKLAFTRIAHADTEPSDVKQRVREHYDYRY